LDVCAVESRLNGFGVSESGRELVEGRGCEIRTIINFRVLISSASFNQSDDIILRERNVATSVQLQASF